RSRGSVREPYAFYLVLPAVGIGLLSNILLGVRLESLPVSALYVFVAGAEHRTRVLGGSEAYEVRRGRASYCPSLVLPRRFGLDLHEQRHHLRRNVLYLLCSLSRTVRRASGELPSFLEGIRRILSLLPVRTEFEGNGRRATHRIVGLRASLLESAAL